MKKALTTPITFRHEATLENRIVMAPMITLSGTYTGVVTQEQLDYYVPKLAA